MAIEMVENEFRKEIVKSGKSAVVLFYMSHCPHCMAFIPKFRELCKSFGVMTMQLDISNYDSDLWEEYHIEAVPTVIAFKQGQVCARVDAASHIGLSFERLIEEIRNKPDAFGTSSDNDT